MPFDYQTMTFYDDVTGEPSYPFSNSRAQQSAQEERKAKAEADAFWAKNTLGSQAGKQDDEKGKKEAVKRKAKKDAAARQAAAAKALAAAKPQPKNKQGKEKAPPTCPQEKEKAPPTRPAAELWAKLLHSDMIRAALASNSWNVLLRAARDNEARIRSVEAEIRALEVAAVPAAWTTRFTNLQKRFPDVPANRVATTLIEVGGHAGKAANELSKGGGQDHGASAVGVGSGSKAPDMVARGVSGKPTISIKVEYISAEAAASVQFRWESLRGSKVIGSLPASPETTIGDLVREVEARCGPIRRKIQRIKIGRASFDSMAGVSALPVKQTLKSLGMEGGGRLAAEVWIDGNEKMHINTHSNN